MTMRDDVPETAWQMFARNDVALAMRLAPALYFRLAFRFEPELARDVLRRAIDGELEVVAAPASWLEIARVAFVMGAEALSQGALGRAEDGLDTMVNKARSDEVRRDIAWLRQWAARGDAAPESVEQSGEIPLAVLDYRRPDTRASDTADYLNTAAALGHLTCRRGLRFVGEDDLARTASRLQQGVAPDRALDGGDATVRLYRVDRDASSFAAIPDGTWLIASGWFVDQLATMRHDLPLDSRLRPLFIGFETGATQLLEPGAVEYLRRYAPIGCRSWNTVFLLQAAGIPAFFSGWMQTTLDTVAAAADHDGTGSTVLKALHALSGRRGSPQTTTDLGSYVALRAVGGRVTLQPELPNDSTLEDVAGISDAEFDRQRQGIAEKLRSVLDAITAGKGENDVYAIWREACAADVARAEARRGELGEIDPPAFDFVAACAAVHRASAVYERSVPGPDGAEIDVEFSLDGNFKHQLDVVLESVVSRTSRPIRAYVLCRDHDRSDYERMASLFPEVSFVWLPMDAIDYGRVTGMIRHITVATMDRLLLPELLPDVDLILHHDLDALCLHDLAELYDVPMGDSPIAARDQMSPNLGSGFVSLTRAARRMRTPALSRELILRTHTRMAFDFKTFNAGVMVLNLARMRADEFCRHYLPYVERFGFNDQAVLNSYAGSERYAIDPRWNAFPKLEVVDDARIMHWIGPMKPWSEEYMIGRERWVLAERAVAARIAQRQR
jgi:lipopolysaccharide biosynthesis glycosyltransferase